MAVRLFKKAYASLCRGRGGRHKLTRHKLSKNGPRHKLSKVFQS